MRLADGTCEAFRVFQAAEGIRWVFGTRPILPCDSILLQNLDPARLAPVEMWLCLKVYQRVVISDNGEVDSLQIAAPYAQGVHDSQELFISGGVLDFRGAQFARFIRNGLRFLSENGAYCIVAGIRNELKGLGEVW
jgi:hypothetical protein